jgi:hypothetical protein
LRRDGFLKNLILIAPFAVFSPKFFGMEQEKKNTGMYWLLFFASTAALLFAIFVHWEYLTMIIPFVCLSFVKAMDII